MMRLHLRQIQRLERRVNAFTFIQQEAILEHQVTSLKDEGLSGQCIAIKDNISVKGWPMTCASHYTAPFNATVVQRLLDANALLIGKTNLDEFGMGSATTHTTHDPTINPLYPHEERSAGGSSGGSAAAVAADMCFAALGSDTGGSIRLPASYCGVVGFKPSYGRLSRHGLTAYADTLDTIGIIARRVNHVESIHKVLDGWDPRDMTSMRPSTRAFLDQTRTLDKVVIGVPSEYCVAELSPDMKLAWDGGLQTLESLGATIVPVSLPHTRHALPAYYVLALAEAASNLARYDGMEYGLRHEDVAATRQLGFGQEVRRRLMLGYHVLTQSAYEDYYVKAQRIRRLIVEDFDRVFKRVRHTHQSLQGQVDALVVPTALGKAPLLSECNEDDWVNDVMTVPASLAGLPAISLPCGGGLGLQVLTQFGDEQMLFHVSKLLERE